MTTKNISIFISKIRSSLENDNFLSIKLGKASNKGSQYKNVFIKQVILNNSNQLNFVFNNKTQDITKNCNTKEGITKIGELLGVEFKNAVLFTQNKDYTLSYNKKGIPKLTQSKATKSGISLQHNKIKKRLIETQNNIYLEKLGVINSNGITVNSKVGKLRQIHKFVENLDSSIKQPSLLNKKQISVTDMGSGKGYLTFAVYDYIKNVLDKQVLVNGIEFRKDLVKKCNDIALDCSFNNLSFTQGTIQDTTLETNDILIALHACDTATDDAIYKGITSNSEIIILSPCCHKQIRKEISVKNELSEIVKHGIFMERQSEMVTDTLRGLLLELHGYKTKIFEYISDEHTHKNTMIVGIKHSNKINTKEIQNKIQDFKELFGIENVYLEDLLIEN